MSTPQSQQLHSETIILQQQRDPELAEDYADTIPTREAQDNDRPKSQQQAYSYDFLCDREVATVAARQGSSLSFKNSEMGHSAPSPHVFMLNSSEGSKQVKANTNSAQNIGEIHVTEDGVQYIEEEYYIEEEVEESLEESVEHQSVQTRGVETIKEVSTEQENASPGAEPIDNDDPRTNAEEMPLGTIMQTASLSPKKQRHTESVGVAKSHMDIVTSGCKEFNQCNSSSKVTDSNSNSNMASLVFKPRDSDATQPAMMSINSNKSNNSRDNNRIVRKESHLSFGAKVVSIPTKWTNMVEKYALKMISKDIYAQLSKISDVFQRRLIQQEVILNNQSQMQLKSFLEISLQNCKQGDLNLTQQEQQAAFKDLHSLSITEVQAAIAGKIEKFISSLQDYFHGEAAMLELVAQERERNAFLETELSAREDRVRPYVLSGERSHESDDRHIQATEQFIEELETQLQQARADMLTAKLTISDQTVAIENLKIKNNIVSAQVSQFLAERNSFEESFENLRHQLNVLQSEKLELSQMIRDRESTMPTSQHQSVINFNSTRAQQQQLMNQSMKSNELKKQVEHLNRQVFDATRKSESLQVVENTLIEKLDRKELENVELKSGLLELKQENKMKGEVINKAQKIIERMTKKSDADEKVLARINAEKEDLKHDILDKTKQITHLSDQLTQARTKQTHDRSKLEQTMARELETVRNAVREYQLELENEKQTYSTKLSYIQGELNAAMEKNETLRQAAEACEESAQAQAQKSQELVSELQNRLELKEYEVAQIEEQTKGEVQLVQESAKNQIQYLQTRIKEIAEETESNSLSTEKSNENIKKCSKMRSKVEKQLPFVTSVKTELDNMSKEVLSIREALRSESGRREALINQHFDQFEQFKTDVMDSLQLWDEKTSELSGLAERYSGALEEQKRLFVKLKLVVQEKDQLITELKHQLALREQSTIKQVNDVKIELCHSQQTANEDLILAVTLLEEKVLLREKELLIAEESRISFRREYTSVLEERNFFEQKLEEVTEQLKLKETELGVISTQANEKEQHLIKALNITELPITPIIIEQTLQATMADAKRHQDEMKKYCEQLVEIKQEREEERELLNKKVSGLEEQYAALQQQAINKEEEQSLEFAQRETELVQELDKVQAYADKIEQELQTRERQLKKIQDKVDEDDKRVEDAQAGIEIVAEEKMEALAQMNAVEQINIRLSDENQSLKNQLRQQEEVTQSIRLDAHSKASKIFDLENEVKDRDYQLQTLKKSETDLDAKITKLEDRNVEISKESHELYQELGTIKSEKIQLENANSKLMDEITSLTKIIKKRQTEIEEHQKSIMIQTRELETLQDRVDENKEQTQMLKKYEDTMKDQAKVIGELTDKLRRPKCKQQSTQTSDSSIIELEFARQEMANSQRQQEVVYQENVQLKDALQRSSYEICQLIDDKRELEYLIEKLNKSICLYKQSLSQQNQAKSTNNFASAESMTLTSNGGFQDELMNKMLAEKQNYINGLENEIGDMRTEIENQRDQLLHMTAQNMELRAAGVKNDSFMGHQKKSFLSSAYQTTPSNYGQNIGISRRHKSGLPSDGACSEVPSKLQATTMNYTTLTRSLTPVDDHDGKRSGYFNNGLGNNSSMAMTNNQTQASAMLNQTHNMSYNAGGFTSGRPIDNASYLNPMNQSSVLMNYQTALNNSVTTNDALGGQLSGLRMWNGHTCSDAQIGAGANEPSDF